jgi:MFS family permease
MNTDRVTAVTAAQGVAAAAGTRHAAGVPGRTGQRPGSTGAIVLVAALLGFFMLSLDSTAVNVALPGIERDLGGSTAGLQWVIDAYTLMFAALLISAGAVSDRVGAKRLYAIGLAAFLASSGQVTAVAALAALTFGVIDGGEAGFGRPAVLGCLLLAAAAMAGFAIAETRAAHPMVPLGLFRSRAVTVCVAIGFAVNVAFYGVIFVLSLYFQRVLGQSAVTAGLEFLPMTALLPVANLTSARVGARFGPQAPIKAGLLVSVAGLVALLAVSTGPDHVLLAVALVLAGTGLGFAVPSVIVVLLDAIPADQAGMGAGLLNSSRQVGGTLAVAVFGALISYRASFLPGMRASLLIAVVVLAAASVAAFALPGPRRENELTGLGG